MSSEEAKELAAKYQALADLLAAKAAGKSLQLAWTQYSNGNGTTMWETTEYFPTIDSDLSKWRIKPDPRKVWSRSSYITDDQEVVEQWRKNGDAITEWQEVQP